MWKDNAVWRLGRNFPREVRLSSVLVLCRRTYELLFDMLRHFFFPLLTFLLLYSFLMLLFFYQHTPGKTTEIHTFLASLSSNLFPLGVPFSNRDSSSLSSLPLPAQLP